MPCEIINFISIGREYFFVQFGIILTSKPEKFFKKIKKGHFLSLTVAIEHSLLPSWQCDSITALIQILHILLHYKIDSNDASFTSNLGATSQINTLKAFIYIY